MLKLATAGVCDSSAVRSCREPLSGQNTGRFGSYRVALYTQAILLPLEDADVTGAHLTRDGAHLWYSEYHRRLLLQLAKQPISSALRSLHVVRGFCGLHVCVACYASPATHIACGTPLRCMLRAFCCAKGQPSDILVAARLHTLRGSKLITPTQHSQASLRAISHHRSRTVDPSVNSECSGGGALGRGSGRAEGR